jgi:chaperonin cofactor prefoldin
VTNDLSIETRLELLEIELDVLAKEIERLDKDMEEFTDKYGITK